MKKKIVATILAVVLVFALACPGVGACGLKEWEQFVDSFDPRAIAAEKLVSDCNHSIELLVRAAQMTPYNDVAALVVSTNSLLRTTTLAVRALGYDVECSYTEYIVDGQSVLIDPLRVINPIVSGGNSGK